MASHRFPFCPTTVFPNANADWNGLLLSFGVSMASIAKTTDVSRSPLFISFGREVFNRPINLCHSWIRILSKIPVDGVEANYLASKPFERYLCLGSVFRYYDA